MERILSEEELQALLKAAQELPPPGAPRIAPGEAVPYDLTSQGRPVRGPLPALDMVDDRFARALRATLTGSLRRRADATPAGRTFVKIEEVLAGLPIPSCLVLFRLEPLRGTGLLILDPTLVYATLDAFLGARASSDEAAELRELTGIEQRIVGRLSRALLEDLAKAWRPVVEVSSEFLQIELNPQFVSVLPAHAVVVDTRIGIDLEGRRTHLRTLISYAGLEPWKDRLVSGVHFHEPGDDSLRPRLWERLQSTAVSVRAELGHTRITVRQLLALNTGDVLTLDASIDEGAILRVEGTRKAAGRPIVSRGAYAVRVERLCPER